MKKHVAIAVVTGIICGCVLRDFCFGPFSGLFIGLIIGIPIAMLIHMALHLFNIPKGKSTSITCALLIIACITTLNIIIYCPSSLRVFKYRISNPVPASVRNIKFKRQYYGADDISDSISFSISETDIKVVIDTNGFIQLKDFVLSGNRFSSDISGGVSFPKKIPWFNIADIKDPTVYYKETDSREFEYLIHDSDSKTAYYYYYNI